MTYIPPSPGLMPNASPDSVTIGGTQAAPPAAQQIANLGTLAAGQYFIELTIQMSGTAETLLTNLRIVDNTVTFVTGIPTLQSAVPYKIIVPKLTIDGLGPVQVRPVAAATAGTVYTVHATATKIA